MVVIKTIERDDSESDVSVLQIMGEISLILILNVRKHFWFH